MRSYREREILGLIYFQYQNTILIGIFAQAVAVFMYSLISLQRWTETYIRWSPQGTYLATFHAKGIALWGGEKFEQIMRFSHPGVQLIDFSPCERYMVTFSPILSTQEDQQQIIIWDIRTGMKKRGFHCETQSTWPILKSVSMMYLLSDNEFDQICLAQLDIKEILKMNIFRLQVEQ